LLISAIFLWRFRLSAAVMKNKFFWNVTPCRLAVTDVSEELTGSNIFDYLAPKTTPWSRVLLEKLTGRQLVKKFPAFYGTRRFITALTRARHLSLS
jgi:hypothetical protein